MKKLVVIFLLGLFTLSMTANTVIAQTTSQIFESNGFQYYWVQDPESKATTPIFVSGIGRPQLIKINAILNKQFLSNLSDYRQCLQTAREEHGEEKYAELHYTTKIEHISATLISIKYSVGGSCGGRHDYSETIVNINPKTGGILQLSDFTPPYMDVDEFVYMTLVKLYPKQMKTPATLDECDYSDQSVWVDASWTVTPKGLKVDPRFSRAQLACEGIEWAIIPWDEISVR